MVTVSSGTQILALKKSSDILIFPHWMNVISSKKCNFLPQYNFKFIETYSAFTFCSQELAILCFWAWNWHFWKKLHSSNHGTIEYQSFFSKLKFGYLSLLWPYLWVFMTSIGNIWVWDPSWLSCALGQPEWHKSCAKSKEIMYKSCWIPFIHTSA